MEARKLFIASGGGELRVVPCLNEHPAWIHALADIVLRQLMGWLAPPPDAAERETTQLRARSLGAVK